MLRNKSGSGQGGFVGGVAVGCLLGTAAALWVATYAFGTSTSDRQGLKEAVHTRRLANTLESNALHLEPLYILLPQAPT